MNRVDRLYAILLMLQRKHRLRAQDLAQEFDVSERTIYRDMDALCETGVPVLGTPGEGYVLMQGYYLPPLLLTPSEATTVYLGVKMMQVFSTGKRASEAEHTLMKITRVLPKDARAAAEHLAEGIRVSLPVPRLSLVEALPSSGGYPDQTQPHEAPLPNGLPVVRVRITNRILPFVRERQHLGYRGEERVPDSDDVIMTYHAAQLTDFLPWLLAWGANAIPLEPPQLREAVRQEAVATLERLA